MKRQKIRKLLLILSLLLFPVTLYYFSPALIFEAGMKGIINGSFLVFAAMFVLSVPFGRIFCAYLCPAGGLQECVFAVNDKFPKQGWRNMECIQCGACIDQCPRSVLAYGFDARQDDRS